MEAYKERYVKEYDELIVRLNKLHNILKKEAEGKLDFTLNCPLELLLEQERYMIGYAHVLIKRAVYEKVELNVDAFLKIFMPL